MDLLTVTKSLYECVFVGAADMVKNVRNGIWIMGLVTVSGLKQTIPIHVNVHPLFQFYSPWLSKTHHAGCQRLLTETQWFLGYLKTIGLQRCWSWEKSDHHPGPMSVHPYCQASAVCQKAICAGPRAGHVPPSISPPAACCPPEHCACWTGTPWLTIWHYTSSYYFAKVTRKFKSQDCQRALTCSRYV